MSATITAKIVTDALIMVIWREVRPDVLLHHSDRGSRYASAQFQPSMTIAGSPAA